MTASSLAERMNIRLKEAILATCSTEECQKRMVTSSLYSNPTVIRSYYHYICVQVTIENHRG
jgi:hypothetical protein